MTSAAEGIPNVNRACCNSPCNVSSRASGCAGDAIEALPDAGADRGEAEGRSGRPMTGWRPWDRGTASARQACVNELTSLPGFLISTRWGQETR